MHTSILNAIGGTPLVEIRRLNPNPRVKVLAKLEYVNPGGSIKDRAALAMIEDGEKSGDLTHDKIVIEATSGNTGIGLALICAVKGYRLLLAMSEAVSVERQKILRARGAEILLTPGHMGTDGAIEEVYRICRENPGIYFMTDQYNNDANWKAHYDGTAEEIWHQTNGDVSVFVATIGTSGTLMGVSRNFKEKDASIRIVGVEPYLGHKIQGLKNMKEAYRPEIFEKQRLDEKINIDDEDAFEMTRRLAKEEGLLVGMSSGAAMAVAARVAERMSEGTVVVVFPDGGERYLSTSLFAVRDEIDVRLYNTMTRRKEAFEPNVPGEVKIYSCGPSAHAPMNINELRRCVFQDLLCRYFSAKGFRVQHVMNFSDLDDKTIQGSEDAQMQLADFTDQHIRQSLIDLESLGVRPATAYPRSSEHVQDMVDLAGRLFKKGYAYEKLRSLYFNISRAKDYGRLSGVDLDKIRLGATVDLDEYEKDNPKDFTLLKRSRLTELKRGIYLKTEWGNVRPSWHLQCASIALKYFGDSYDIHASGRELIFPHHENEIAIAAAVSGKPQARYWLHCERVFVDAVDAASTLSDLLSRGFDAREVRYWMVSGHYRKPLGFSPERLIDAGRALQRMDVCMERLQNVRLGGNYPEINQLAYDLRNGFFSAMDDDLNVSAALATIFGNIKKINKLVTQQALSEDNAQFLLETFRQIDTVLGFFRFEPPKTDDRVKELIAKRIQARKNRDWSEADRIRDELRELGVSVKDSKAGVLHDG